MLLRNVKKLFSNTGSIATRLTLFYSLSTFILITIVSLFFYFAIINIFHSANRQFISDEINIVKNILKNKPNNFLALKQEVTDIPYSLNSSAYHYYIRVLDKNNKIIIETPKINNILPPYIQMQSSINLKDKTSPWRIQVILDISYQHQIIHKYRMIVIFVSLGGAIISILFGYFISQRGMRRLQELTDVTKKITAHAIQQRIDPKQWPKELNELGAAYNQMLDRIESSISRLIAFSDDLAHELRTPLTNLMGQTEIALSRDYSLEGHKTLLESNLEELNRLNLIIENLLFLARTENPQIELEKTLLHVTQEINIVSQFYEAIADEKSIKILCNGQASLLANSVMFRRMIGNLLANAIKYSPRNNKILIKVTEKNDDTVKISIIDNGIGISVEHLPNIFSRFYRADTARTNESGGTGLGLAIVKSIVDLHHGSISISSTLNKGTTVIINLPK